VRLEGGQTTTHSTAKSFGSRLSGQLDTCLATMSSYSRIRILSTVAASWKTSIKIETMYTQTDERKRRGPEGTG